MPNSEDCLFMTNHCAYKRTNEQKPENYQIIKFMEKQTDQNTNNEKPTSTKKITRTNTEEIIPRLIPRPSSLCDKFSLMQKKKIKENRN